MTHSRCGRLQRSPRVRSGVRTAVRQSRAARYRRRGLDRTARRMVDLLTEAGIDGATVLEIGGGVGEIELELLERGAASGHRPGALAGL